MADKPVSKSATITIVLLLFLFLSIIGERIWQFNDSYFWIAWATHIHKNGLSEAYGSGTNYMPLMQYVLYAYGKAMGSVEGIQQHVGALKSFALLFDFIGLWYVSLYVHKNATYLEVLLINIFNFGFVYNSLVWGQVDAVLATLNFIAVYYALKGRLTLSAAVYMIAFNMKVQAVVLLPVLGIFYILNVMDKRTWTSALLPFAAMAVVQFVFLIPFLGSVQSLKQISDVIINSVGSHPAVSLNAYNFWYLVYYSTANPFYLPDTTIFLGGMSCNKTGLLLFCLSSALALYPLLRVLMLRVGGRTVKMIAGHKVLLICALLYLLFFYFNTQMHERYSHPAFLFIIAYAFYKRRYLIYVLFSLAYFLSLEKVMQWMALKNYQTVIFNPLVLAFAYGTIIVLMFYELYKREPPVFGRQSIK